MYVFVFVCVCVSLSLSPYIYIYVCIYVLLSCTLKKGPLPLRSSDRLRQRQAGLAARRGGRCQDEGCWGPSSHRSWAAVECWLGLIILYTIHVCIYRYTYVHVFLCIYIYIYARFCLFICLLCTYKYSSV